MMTKVSTANKALEIAHKKGYDYVAQDGIFKFGLLGWMAPQATDILKEMCSFNIRDAESSIGTLADEVMADINMINRTLSSSEITKLASFISRPENKTIQNKYAEQTMLSFVNTAIKNGLTEPLAVMYYCDMAVEYGNDSMMLKNILKKAVEKGGTLEAIHSTTLESPDNKRDERKDTYVKLSLMLNDEQDDDDYGKKYDIGSERYEEMLNCVNIYVNAILHPEIDADDFEIERNVSNLKKSLVQCLQRAENIDAGENIVPEDGKVSKETLNAYKTVSTIRNSSTMTASVIKFLICINGYDTVNLSGVFDDDTEKALKLFQKNHGIEPSGDADVSTARLLMM
jgi:hypothetical protein